MDNKFSYFSRAERTGIIVLMLLCVVLLIAPTLFPERSSSVPTDFSDLEAQIAAWETETETTEATSPLTTAAGTTTTPTAFLANAATEAELKAAGLSARATRAWLSYVRKGGKFYQWKDVERFRALSEEERAAIKPYVRFAENLSSAGSADTPSTAVAITENFNPNEVDKASLIAMGLPAKVANNWTRFLASGGRFRQAEDIQKIYGLSEADFARLLPYARVPEPSEAAGTTKAGAEAGDIPTSYDAPARDVIIDINAASAEEWQSLRGIGPAYSKRIVNFRDKLGGFHSVRQVGETYGLPDSVFQKIQLQLRPSAILRKLPINTATVEELAAHPYLGFSEARMIVNYREQHGAYISATDLDKLYGLEEATKQRILPYLVY